MIRRLRLPTPSFAATSSSRASYAGDAFELAGAARITVGAITVEATSFWAHMYAVNEATLLVEVWGGRIEDHADCGLIRYGSARATDLVDHDRTGIAFLDATEVVDTE